MIIYRSTLIPGLIIVFGVDWPIIFELFLLCFFDPHGIIFEKLPLVNLWVFFKMHFFTVMTQFKMKARQFGAANCISAIFFELPQFPSFSFLLLETVFDRMLQHELKEKT